MVQGQCTSFNHRHYFDRQWVTFGHREEEKVYSRHGFTEINYGLDLWAKILLKGTTSIHFYPQSLVG